MIILVSCIVASSPITEWTYAPNKIDARVKEMKTWQEAASKDPSPTVKQDAIAAYVQKRPKPAWIEKTAAWVEGGYKLGVGSRKMASQNMALKLATMGALSEAGSAKTTQEKSDGALKTTTQVDAQGVVEVDWYWDPESKTAWVLAAKKQD